MKKIFTYLGFISLICFSFILTEKTSNLLIDKDELMMTIKSSSNNYEVEPIDGIILDNTFIPGINGLKVDNKKSYKEMKNYGVFNEGLLEFKQVSPKNKLNDNYGDKYNIVKLNIEHPDTAIFNSKFHIYPNLPYILMFP